MEFVLHDDFPDDVEFLEGSAENHVIVKWEIVGANDTFRRNAPFVIVIDRQAIDLHDASNSRGQTRIERRVRELVEHRRQHYAPDGPVDVAIPFIVEIDEWTGQSFIDTHEPFSA
ncbi:MAG: hypothetical protein IOC39_34740 [Burkholderia sp.]|nr:hypothetical protein [Burkholderia sp.]MCA3792116.1 hypothetical protein [Burkholderia sp.]MCA3820987.1 hypothetical protein [Burkholderia sp.]MCA3837827.1 hypothetical protein [Burkholderia sp.]MCA3851078.1 hypothetical protein [Burkholderia sp.]